MPPAPPDTPDIVRWQQLCDAAVQPAPMACPAFARAARQHLPLRQAPWLCSVADAQGMVRALAPLRLKRWRWPGLGRVAGNHWGEFFFLGTPLIAASDPVAAWQDLLHAVRRWGAAALELRTVPADGPLIESLRAAVAAHGGQVVELARWKRAVLDAERCADEWWRQDVSRKRRKEWARLRRKLAEQGDVVFEALAVDAPAAEQHAWMDDFLALEAAGWKGRRGTALACSPHNEAFVRAMTAGFHADGNLRHWRLRLDGHTIASLFAMVQGDALWLGKIAYDEDPALRRFSPGVLLTIEATRAIMAEPGIRHADSSADSDHPMIDHIWKQRLELVDVLVSLPGVSRTRFAALLAMERACRAARAQAKRAFHVLRAARR